MTQLFKNAARSALMAPLAAIDTSLTADITVADLFPAADTGTDPVPTVGKDWFKVVVEDASHNYEIMYVRTRTLGSATMSNLLRGQEGTTAISFAAGSIIELRQTADDLQDAIDLAAQATTPGKNLLWAATVDAQVQALGSALQKQIATAFTTTGTSTAYLLTPTPAITAYVANLSFDVTFDKVCGDNPTLQISGVATPPNLVKQLINGSYANIKAGDIPANHRSRVTLLSPTQAWVESLPNLFRIGAGADIASAATVDFTARTGNVVRVTGTTPTDTITLETGGVVFCIAAAAWPLTYHATTNPVQGGASYTCEAGDIVVYMKDGSDVLHNWVIKSDGAPVAGVDSPFDLTASVAGNALTITLKKGGWFFRNATLGTGEFEYVKTNTDLTLTISSGSTLGGVNAVPTGVLVRVVNDGGTLRLTAENQAGGMDSSETGVISTTAEGGAGGADSSTTIYSSTAVTSKAYRCAGIVVSTQAAAGTWATAPSLIQGAGGQAVAAMSSLGYGQTWQNVTGSRGGATTYYNTTGKPIVVSAYSIATGAGQYDLTVNGLIISSSAYNGSSGIICVTAVVPPGGSYSLSNVTNINKWMELR